MISDKLKPGDEIRVISPSKSLSIVSQEIQDIAINQLQNMGLAVTFSENSSKRDEFNSASVEERIEDIHRAFLDRNVKAIITSIGGYNSNQLLSSLRYDLIQDNPKILCGFSDITALTNAIYSKTGLVTYSGPHFSSFGMEKGIEYTVDYFKKCLFDDTPYSILPSSNWSDDEWYLNQDDRHFNGNRGYMVVNEGNATGKLIGGNLCTFGLLRGTEYMSDFKESILLLEEDDSSTPEVFDRQLESIIHQPNFSELKGILLGRFQKRSNISSELLLRILSSKRKLASIPIIANLDFGHTTPQLTLPIGGVLQVEATRSYINLSVITH